MHALCGIWYNAVDSIIKGLKNLDSLILAHNQLSKVPENVFSHLTLLNSLELEGNQITYVDKDAFAGLEGRSNVIFCYKFLCMKWMNEIFSCSNNFFTCFWQLKCTVIHCKLKLCLIVCNIWFHLKSIYFKCLIIDWI